MEMTPPAPAGPRASPRRGPALLRDKEPPPMRRRAGPMAWVVTSWRTEELERMLSAAARAAVAAARAAAARAARRARRAADRTAVEAAAGLDALERLGLQLRGAVGGAPGGGGPGRGTALRGGPPQRVRGARRRPRDAPPAGARQHAQQRAGRALPRHDRGLSRRAGGRYGPPPPWPTSSSRSRSTTTTTSATS